MRRTKEEAEQTRKNILAAARRVFHEFGVSQSSLERVAKAAGVTRGAIYWHFKNKTELFFALREDICHALNERTDAIFFDPSWENPLDAISAALKEFFRLFYANPEVKEIFEIMILRCEYVGEFTNVLEELRRPAVLLLENVERLYRLAEERHQLRAGICPKNAALDTWLYVHGMVNQMTQGGVEAFNLRFEELIDLHMQLRRL